MFLKPPLLTKEDAEIADSRAKQFFESISFSAGDTSVESEVGYELPLDFINTFNRKKKSFDLLTEAVSLVHRPVEREIKLSKWANPIIANVDFSRVVISPNPQIDHLKKLGMRAGNEKKRGKRKTDIRK